MLKTLIFFLSLWGLLSCGVKGDPLPPGSPVKISRGDPEKDFNFEKFKFPQKPTDKVLDLISDDKKEEKP